MPIIDITVKAKSDPRHVYDLAKDVSNFPSFMKDVKNIEIIKDGAKKRVAYWNIDFDGVPVEWTEECIYDDSKRMIKFNMIKGDFYSYKGKWSFCKSDGGTKIRIFSFIEWGAPKFERFVGHILDKKAHNALLSMLLSLKRKAEKDG